MPVEISLSQTVEDYLNKRSNLNKGLNHYDILELDPKCSKEDIRHSYYHFAKMFHPDKCGNDEYAFLLDQVKTAYETLSNEYKRVHYDIINGNYDNEVTDEKLVAIYDLMRQKYYTFITENAETYILLVNSEFIQQGLIIKKALYGNLTLINPEGLRSLVTIENKHLKGPYIDVTVQLQLLIQNGVLNLNSGAPTSFGHLPGFYNPIDFERSEGINESQLYILYLFKNNVHEVTVNDHSCVRLPMKSHLVYGNYIKGPFSLSNLALMA
ncbi:hypothetical protein MACJ_001495 [Theileria orientalis]|uniref:J domain-containing protein n=1 Tax=Theileria orientalis TaxID=68886 RepID=A0A976MAZ0_THEOR|nr:hypothetical protein MACJ_001495 [Theileria orientalis]